MRLILNMHYWLVSCFLNAHYAGACDVRLLNETGCDWPMIGYERMFLSSAVAAVYDAMALTVNTLKKPSKPHDCCRDSCRVSSFVQQLGVTNRVHVTDMHDYYNIVGL